jgi:hypothetical protein
LQHARPGTHAKELKGRFDLAGLVAVQAAVMPQIYPPAAPRTSLRRCAGPIGFDLPEAREQLGLRDSLPVAQKREDRSQQDGLLLNTPLQLGSHLLQAGNISPRIV